MSLISERARKVLSQVITLHYNTCGPVGSSLISRTRVVPFSPATIRNIMMRLETGGYLVQPHTSAGRLPTDLGYRTYVDELKISSNGLAETEKKELDAQIEKAINGPAILRAIAEHIQKKTQLLVFHLPFKDSGIKLKHIHFERINNDRLLVLWIARGGHTFQSVLDLGEDKFASSMVEKTENYFNNALVGKNLMEIHRLLVGKYGRPDSEWDLLLSKAARVANALMDEAGRFDGLTFRGVGNLLDMPEFQNNGHIRVVFDLVEQQTKVKDLVRQTVQGKHNWLMFFIGKELAEPDMDNLTMAVARLDTQDSTLGCVGVIGPKRMPYPESLKMLSYAREKLAARAL